MIRPADRSPDTRARNFWNEEDEYKTLRPLVTDSTYGNLKLSGKIMKWRKKNKSLYFQSTNKAPEY